MGSGGDGVWRSLPDSVLVTKSRHEVSRLCRGGCWSSDLVECLKRKKAVCSVLYLV